MSALLAPARRPLSLTQLCWKSLSSCCFFIGSEIKLSSGQVWNLSDDLFLRECLFWQMPKSLEYLNHYHGSPWTHFVMSIGKGCVPKPQFHNLYFYKSKYTLDNWPYHLIISPNNGFIYNYFKTSYYFTRYFSTAYVK